MMNKLQALWAGDVPLGDAFWTWAVFGGLLVNISSSALLLILITLDRPWLALMAGYGFSVPYNLAVMVGVWRSADRYDGPTLHANLARGATVILMTLLTVT
ncbi:hypothetical protein [Fodinicurvata fenggangensis]|uniref:hypothetical protein n=1 Tax=Fodinicurvata fenggangensis TaxID=1121830 RepID=UPI001B8081DC|nr:hypothetical protein [Fodinicurvata fenggangensis]